VGILVGIVGTFFKVQVRRSMFASQREESADSHIIALVELDMQKMRLRIVLVREAIRERIWELEHSRNHPGDRSDI
jgi:hypothetical protein